MLVQTIELPDHELITTPAVFWGREALTGLSLTGVAGFIDAIGFLALGGLFASFMSGASISLGVGTGALQSDAVIGSLLMVATFLAGVALGTIVGTVAGSWALPIVLFLEAILLAGAVTLAHFGWSASILILPLTTAMGVQNTAIAPIAGARAGATFITGTLVSLGQSLGSAVIGRNIRRNWLPYAVLWAAFVLGACAGAFLYHGLDLLALAVPTILVILLAIANAVSIAARGDVQRLKTTGLSAEDEFVRHQVRLHLERKFAQPYY